ncbi:hypothetical protein ACWD5Z_03565 [Micromonospora chokoriensis]
MSYNANPKQSDRKLGASERKVNRRSQAATTKQACQDRAPLDGTDGDHDPYPGHHFGAAEEVSSLKCLVTALPMGSASQMTEP